LLEQISVAEMMSTSYLALPSSFLLLEAGQKMLRRKCHTALVVDKEGKLIGVVTLNDIKRNILELQLTRSPDLPQLQDICTLEVLYTYPEEPVNSALERMGTRGLYLLPVVKPDNPRHVLGVISRQQISLAGDLIATQEVLKGYLRVYNS
jgi:CBS domain-containing protein